MLRVLEHLKKRSGEYTGAVSERMGENRFPCLRSSVGDGLEWIGMGCGDEVGGVEVVSGHLCGDVEISEGRKATAAFDATRPLVMDRLTLRSSRRSLDPLVGTEQLAVTSKMLVYIH